MFTIEDLPTLERPMKATSGMSFAGSVLMETPPVTNRVERTNHHALLHVEYDEAVGAPHSMFCKLLPSDPARRAAVAAL